MAEVPPGAGNPGGGSADPAAKAQAAIAQAAALPADKVGAKADCPAEVEAARRKAEIDQKLADLSTQGHGPQRHEGDVTPQQLIDRAVHGHDPLTGTTTDRVTGALILGSTELVPSTNFMTG